MDIIKLLTDDHDHVDELFRRFQIAERADTRAELGKEIVHELSVHAAVEEQFLYPLVRLKLEGGGELADHSIEEHAEVKRLLTDVEKLDAESVDYRETVEEVIDSVRHHVEDEEGDMFPQLEEATSDDLRDRIGAVVDTAKGLVPTHPHPLVPGTATAQLVAGPWATAIDKARDLLDAR